jgi:RNA polymerase sigma-70 factor (ECF subfamily)
LEQHQNHNDAGRGQEGQWVEAAKQDPKAFQHIFDAYHDTIFNYVLRRTGNVSLSEDLTANTFMKAMDAIGKFRWQGVSLSAWLYRIATNEINLNYRKQRRMVPLTDEMRSGLKDEQRADTRLLAIEENMEKNKAFQSVCAELSKLKIKYQTVLTLRYFEDKSIKEIAEILEMSENTVKTHIRRGLERLRSQL